MFHYNYDLNQFPLEYFIIINLINNNFIFYKMGKKQAVKQAQ